MMVGVTSTKKKVSKKRKSSWRKYSDVKDVEEFLEEKRVQERTGGSLKEKPNKALFTVQKTGVVKDIGQRQQETKRRKRASIKDIKLKCHETLEIKSNIECPGVENKGVRKVKDKRSSMVKKLESAGYQSRQVITARAQRMQQREQKVDERRNRSRLPVVQYDLWDEKNNNNITGNSRPSAISDKMNTYHIDSVMRKVRPRMNEKQRLKRSHLPAVEVCDAGASYNPTFEDHQQLLLKAAEKEVDKLKAEEKIDRWALQVPKTTNEETNERWLSEMSAGLNEPVNHEQQPTGDLESALIGNPAVDRNRLKPKQQRRKEKERKALELQRAELKRQRQNESNYYKIKSIKASIDSEIEKQQKNRREKKERKLADQLNKPKRLGALKYAEPDVEVNLSEDITGSLRTIKTEGNLIEDRFLSLQKRNLLEPRQRVRRKNTYKRKSFPKKVSAVL